ncbi:MAG: hypothetical protein KJ630_24205 [Proteobacteria bacterium]|nr:hypothetical protein [Pseudomonadota bacterium]
MTSSSLCRQVKQAMLFCLLGLFPVNVVASSATVPLHHGPVQSTPAGKSVPISVTIADGDNLFEVRLYFKTMAAADYFFLPMTGSSKGIFTASLPPAKNDTRGIDYLLLLKNSQGEVRKTKPFRLLVLNDYNTPLPSPCEFEVFTEQSSIEVENRDFASPLQIVQSPEPLLAYAVEDPYPPRVITNSGSGEKVFSGLSNLGGISFSIKIGGVGLFYRGFSGH